jgi:hypothetical protein
MTSLLVVGFRGSRSLVALLETALAVEWYLDTFGEEGQKEEVLKVVGENAKVENLEI